MPVIYPGREKVVRRGGKLRRIAIVLGASATMLVGANFLLCAIYSGRTYPNTMVMKQSVGSVNYTKLHDIATKVGTPPDNVIFSAGQTIAVSKPYISVITDASITVASAKQQHSPWALVEIFRVHTLAAPLRIDQTILQQKTLPSLTQKFNTQPQNAQITLASGAFTLTPDINGQTVDAQNLGQTILTALDKKANVQVPLKVITAPITAKSLEPTKNNLQRQLETTLRFSYANKSFVANIRDIAAWFVQTNGNFAVDDLRVKQFIADNGAHAKNLNNAVDATKKSLTNHTNLDFNLQPYDKTKTITYCANVRGVSTAKLPELKNKLLAVLGDVRGWSLEGQVIYEYADQDCDFTVWLASNDQMTSFGGACAEYWNCMSGNNVVANVDRWNNTTPEWLASGGNLDEYRTLLINHETGHWLGFLDNFTCAGTGQAAPVMMQQSINRFGCAFNPRPTTPETAQLRQRLDL
jgi:hypothetical protein